MSKARLGKNLDISSISSFQFSDISSTSSATYDSDTIFVTDEDSSSMSKRRNKKYSDDYSDSDSDSDSYDSLDDLNNCDHSFSTIDDNYTPQQPPNTMNQIRNSSQIPQQTQIIDDKSSKEIEDDEDAILSTIFKRAGTKDPLTTAPQPNQRKEIPINRMPPQQMRQPPQQMRQPPMRPIPQMMPPQQMRQTPMMMNQDIIPRGMIPENMVKAERSDHPPLRINDPLPFNNMGSVPRNTGYSDSRNFGSSDPRGIQFSAPRGTNVRTYIIDDDSTNDDDDTTNNNDDDNYALKPLKTNYPVTPPAQPPPQSVYQEQPPPGYPISQPSSFAPQVPQGQPVVPPMAPGQFSGPPTMRMMAGFQGKKGKVGGDGKEGLQGRRGKTGVSVKGDPGDPGRPGFQGKMGLSVKGEKGDQGREGFQGKMGLSVKGEQGDQGKDGFQGKKGEKGDKGQSAVRFTEMIMFDLLAASSNKHTNVSYQTALMMDMGCISCVMGFNNIGSYTNQIDIDVQGLSFDVRTINAKIIYHNGKGLAGYAPTISREKNSKIYRLQFTVSELDSSISGLIPMGTLTIQYLE